SGIVDLARTLAWLASLGHKVCLTEWDNGAQSQPRVKEHKKPALTIPLCGANYFKPKPRKPASPARPAAPVVADRMPKPGKPSPSPVPSDATMPLRSTMSGSFSSAGSSGSLPNPAHANGPNKGSLPAPSASYTQALQMARESMTVLQK